MKINEFVENIDEEDYKIKPLQMFSVKQRLKQCLIQDKINIPDTHRKKEGYLSISQLAGDSCKRKLYYQYKSEEKDDTYSLQSDLTLKVGTMYHELVQGTMLRNPEISKIFLVEQFLQDDELKICGSTDGCFYDDDGEMVINDFKTCSLSALERIKNSGKAKKDHIAQVHWYQYLIKKMYGHDIKRFKITYLCKNQMGYYPEIYGVKKNLSEVLNYLKSTSDKMKTPSENLVQNISKIEYSFKTLEYGEKMSKEGEYLIYEVNFEYSDEVMQKELQKIDDFWNIVLYNDNRKQNKKGELPKEKFPNRITKKYYCVSCPYLSKCRPEMYNEIKESETN